MYRLSLNRLSSCIVYRLSLKSMYRRCQTHCCFSQLHNMQLHKASVCTASLLCLFFKIALIGSFHHLDSQQHTLLSFTSDKIGKYIRMSPFHWDDLERATAIQGTLQRDRSLSIIHTICISISRGAEPARRAADGRLRAAPTRDKAVPRADRRGSSATLRSGVYVEHVSWDGLPYSIEESRGSVTGRHN